MNDPRMGIVVSKGVQVPLTMEEADVYFASTWYKEQIKQKRHKLIDQGFVKVGGWHENNPAHLQPKEVVRVGPAVLPLPIIRK